MWVSIHTVGGELTRLGPAAPVPTESAPPPAVGSPVWSPSAENVEWEARNRKSACEMIQPGCRGGAPHTLTCSPKQFQGAVSRGCQVRLMNHVLPVFRSMQFQLQIDVLFYWFLVSRRLADWLLFLHDPRSDTCRVIHRLF